MPALSTSADRLLRLAQNEEHDKFALHRTVIKDPGLALAIVHMASSWSFGANDSVDSIDVAINRIGTAHLAKISLGLALNGMIRQYQDRKRFNPDQVTKHGLFVALMASSIATRSSSVTVWRRAPEEVFSIAIVRDLQLAMLTRVSPDLYDVIAEAAEKLKLPFRVAFEKFLGSSSAQLAQNLFRAWRLPEPLRSTAGHAETSTSMSHGDDQTVCAILLADDYSTRVGLGFETWESRVPSLAALVAVFGLSESELDEIARVAAAEAIEMSAVMDRVAA